MHENNWNPGRWRDLPEVTELANDRAWIWSLVCQTLKTKERLGLDRVVGIRSNGISSAKKRDLKIEPSQRRSNKWLSLFFTQRALRSGFHVHGRKRGSKSKKQLERLGLDVRKPFLSLWITKAPTYCEASSLEAGGYLKWLPWGLEFEPKFGEYMQGLKLPGNSRAKSLLWRPACRSYCSEYRTGSTTKNFLTQNVNSFKDEKPSFNPNASSCNWS